MCLDDGKSVRARARSMRLLQSSVSLVLILLLREPECCRAWTTSSFLRTSTAVERSFARNTVTFLSYDEGNQDTPDPRELQQSMSDLFSVPKKKKSINQDPTGGYTLRDLEDYFSQRTPGSRSPARPIPKLNASLAEEAFPEGGDGLFLDPDLYVKSSQCLNPDGSLNMPDDDLRLKPAQTGRAYQRILRSIVQPAPNSPDSVAPSIYGDVQNMEEVWDALQQQASITTNNPDVTATSEELHRQVFAEEQGYLLQSQVFRESLTDSSKAAEAASLRHGLQFRERQAEAIASLDEQIKEWEEGWEANYAQAQHCAKCKCILAHDEIPMIQKHKGLCQVCYGEMLIAKINYDSLRKGNDEGPPQFRSRPASRPTLARPQITSAQIDLSKVRPEDTTQARPTETTPTNPSPPPTPVYASSTSSAEAPSQIKTPPPPVPRQPEIRRLKTGGTFRPRPTEPTPEDRTVQRREPNEEKDRVESFRRDRAQETLRDLQERVERASGASRSPRVSQDPTKPPRNWPQRPIRPTQPAPIDLVRQNDSMEYSLVNPPTKEANVEKPALPFYARTKVPTPSKDNHDENASNDE